MALVRLTSGQQARVSHLNQLLDLLWGNISDQALQVLSEVSATDFNMLGGSGLWSTSGRYMGGLSGVGPPSGGSPRPLDFGFDVNATRWFYDGTAWRTANRPRFAVKTPAGSSSFTVNIPTGIRHVQMIYRARDNTSNTAATPALIEVNSSTTSIYYNAHGDWDGTNVYGAQPAAATSFSLGPPAEGGGTDGVNFATGVAWWPFVNDTASGKGYIQMSTQLDTTISWGHIYVGFWASTAAITSLTFTCGASSTWGTGSEFDFYGWGG